MEGPGTRCWSWRGVLPQSIFGQSKFPPEPTFREQGPDRQVIKDVFKVFLFIHCREQMGVGISFASLPRSAQQALQNGPPTPSSHGPHRPLTCPMALHALWWRPPSPCLLPRPPHLCPEAADPPGPPESGPQTDGSSSGKQRHRLAHGGHAGSSPHTTAPLGSPGAQPHSTFVPALSGTCSLWARFRGMRRD